MYDIQVVVDIQEAVDEWPLNFYVVVQQEEGEGEMIQYLKDHYKYVEVGASPLDSYQPVVNESQKIEKAEKNNKSKKHFTFNEIKFAV